MLLRIVKVTIAPGKLSEYWEWAKDIVSLWDDGGIVRAGGPFAGTGADGNQMAIWLTVHSSEEEAVASFRALYAAGRGAELIALRPPLVARTETEHLPTWTGLGAAPPAPRW